MNDIKKNEMNEQEMDNVTGGAFKAAGYNQDEVITLEKLCNDSSDTAGQGTAFLRTDSMRMRVDSMK